MNLNFNEIEDYKTITVPVNFIADNTYDVNLNGVPFQPDEIILKNVAIYDSAETPVVNLFIVKSDLVDNQILFSYPPVEALYEMTNIPFRNFKDVNSTFRFTLLGSDNKSPGIIANLYTYLTFTLVFVKYKKRN